MNLMYRYFAHLNNFVVCCYDGLSYLSKGIRAPKNLALTAESLRNYFNFYRLLINDNKCVISEFLLKKTDEKIRSIVEVGYFS